MSALIRTLPPSAVLMALIVAVWAPSLTASFQFDDWSVIVADPRVQSFDSWWRAMPAIRPLWKAMVALGHELGGAPALYRAFNIVLHAISTALVFWLTRRLARRMRTADANGALQVGACCAVVFGLHPVQTEAVTYITGGSVAFMGCCVLASLAAVLRAGDSEHPLPWSIAAILAFLAAIAVRETAVVLPLAVLLWWWAENRGRRPAPRVTLAVMGALLALAAALASLYTAYPWLVQTSFDTRSPLANLLAQGDAISWLLGQLVRWDRLNADPALIVVDALEPLAIVRLVLLVAVLGAALAQWRSRPWLAFGVLWFFLWLAPTNSLLARLDLANERQLYLALIGPAWLLAHALQWLRPQQRWAPLAALALVLATATALRNRVYYDEVTFWQDVVAKSPHNARAANNLGMAYATACRPLAARRAFETAAALAPADSKPQVNRELLDRRELVAGIVCTP
jgi:protein O-mannosyl-transferase